MVCCPFPSHSIAQSADGAMRGGKFAVFPPLDGNSQTADFCRKAVKASAEATLPLGERNALLMALLSKVLLRYF